DSLRSNSSSHKTRIYSIAPVHPSQTYTAWVYISCTNYTLLKPRPLASNLFRNCTHISLNVTVKGSNPASSLVTSAAATVTPSNSLTSSSPPSSPDRKST